MGVIKIEDRILFVENAFNSPDCKVSSKTSLKSGMSHRKSLTFLQPDSKKSHVQDKCLRPPPLPRASSVLGDNETRQGTANQLFLAKRRGARIQNLRKPKSYFLKLVRGRKVNSDTEWDRK